MKRAALVASVAAVLAVLLGATAPSASAHAELITSSPADGAVLPAAPEAVDLTFSEDLLPDTVAVSIVPDGGSPASLGDIAVDGSTVTVAWPAALTSGGVTIGYRVVSEDGHPVDGSVHVTIGTASAAASPAGTADPAADPAAEPAASTAPPTATEDSSGGSGIPPLAWVSLGLAAGIAIGFAFYLRRRPPR